MSQTTIPWWRRGRAKLSFAVFLTVAMFPVLVFMYARLARREEREAIETFGEQYRAYMRAVPAFFARLSRNDDDRRSSAAAPSTDTSGGR